MCICDPENECSVVTYAHCEGQLPHSGDIDTVKLVHAYAHSYETASCQGSEPELEQAGNESWLWPILTCDLEQVT